VGTSTAVQALLYNEGNWVESNVPVSCTIEANGGAAAYSDTAYSGAIHPATWAMVSLEPWLPAVEGEYLLTCQSALGGDVDTSNDVYTQTVTATTCVPDVWMKDNADDTGDVPSAYPWFTSPDLWVRHRADGGMEPQNPIAGQQNTIYVRVRNRGCRTAAWGEVHVFAGPSTLGWQCLTAEPNVGTIAFADLAPGEARVVSLSWTPTEGPYLGLRAVVEADGDPLQWAPGCSPHQPRFDNNIAWRNVHMFDNRIGGAVTETTAAPDEGDVSATAVQVAQVVLNNVSPSSQEVDLIVERLTFPVTGSITVLLPGSLFDRWQAYGGDGSAGIDVAPASKEIRITGAVSGTVGAIPLLASEEAMVGLRYDAPAGTAFEVRLYQGIHGVVVGGASYAWVLPEEVFRIQLPVVMRRR
jgi:hypothetical protein